MRLEGSKTAKLFAKQLRQQMTPPEIALWQALRRNEASLRFRRQHAAGPYILDFYCAPAKLAIEVDGESHNMGNRPAKDAERDAWLSSQSIRILRYDAADVGEHLDSVLEQVTRIASERRTFFEGHRRPPPPTPSAPPPPSGGG